MRKIKHENFSAAWLNNIILKIRREFMQFKFAVGVVWYNPDELAIRQLNEIQEEFDAIYIYDNSEKDNNKLIENLGVKYVYLFNGKNDGISKGLNTIANYCSNFDFLLVLDQDTLIKKDDIHKIKKYINSNYNESTAIYCPTISFGENNYQSERLVDFIDFTITSCSFLNLKIFNKLGKYDEFYFVDGIDRDYCFRVIENGYTICRLNNVIVKQNLGNGRKTPFGIYEHNAIRNYYICFARFYFIYKFSDYYKGLKKFIYLYLSILKQILSIIFFESDKIAKLKYIRKARTDFFAQKRGEV